MRERLTALLTRMGLLRDNTLQSSRDAAELPDDPNVEFRSLSPPQAAALGIDTALVCPVTRQSLQTGSFLYLCRNCNTAYSAEGWDFLRETDKGRCCHCRQVGTVVPFREGETHL
jgi:hypothetical protein